MSLIEIVAARLGYTYLYAIADVYTTTKQTTANGVQSVINQHKYFKCIHYSQFIHRLLWQQKLARRGMKMFAFVKNGSECIFSR